MDEVCELPLIIDIEASGFGRGSYPIEIGVADQHGQTFNFLVKPLTQWQHWDDSAQAIHGISRDSLLQQGMDIGEIADQLNQLFAGKILYTDGWSFDSSWLGLLFHESGRLQGFKLEALTKILSQQQMAIWDETRKQIFLASGEVRHRASVDAKNLQQTYVQTQHL